MKWAIIGCGNISNKFSENLVSIKDIEISCIASKDISRLKKFGDKFKVENKNRFKDYESILGSKFDVAYIGLINSLHKEVILNLTSNQKNIIVPTYNGQQGNPVLFDKSMKEKVMDITGDVGAKKILELNKDKILNLEINDQSITKGFNTQGDFSSL